MSFSTRPFSLPDDFYNQCMSLRTAGTSLTPAIHQYSNQLGDYDLARGWARYLAKQSNWVGDTMNFSHILNSYIQEQKGNLLHRQKMISDNGKTIGYYRLHCLSRDTKNYRQDCGRLHEALVSSLVYLSDMSLFKFIYDDAVTEAGLQGKARLVTELGIGLTQQKFRAAARIISQQQGKDRDDEQERSFQKAYRMFYQDWLAVSVRFIETIGFTIEDIIITRNNSEQDTVTPQLRISRNTRIGMQPVPLPPYQADSRDCIVYRSHESLELLRKRINEMRLAAAQKYKIPSSPR